jgi:dolichol-phosphate mannosyltransferase
MMGAPPPSPLTSPRIVAIPVAHNEERAIGCVLDRLAPVSGVDAAVVDDGSTDGTAATVRARGASLIQRGTRGGAGAAIRTAYAWAREHGYDICVIMSGNDKDRPAEMDALIGPIVRGEADLVQGSRYLAGGAYHNMPMHRQLASRFVHPWLFSAFAGQWMTDTTNGFRALRLSVLDDPRIALDQPWLDAYDLEPYLLLTAIRLGYVVRETPVSKMYPGGRVPYTKMRPVVDWWSIVRPIVMVGLGLRA